MNIESINTGTLTKAVYSSVLQQKKIMHMYYTSFKIQRMQLRPSVIVTMTAHAWTPKNRLHTSIFRLTYQRVAHC